MQKHKKKYNEKRKKIACTVFNDKYEAIKKHSESKGFKSLNSYIISLIEEDMKK